MANMKIYAFSLDETDYVNSERRWLGQDLNISISEENINEFVGELDALLSGKRESISYRCLSLERICSVDDVNEVRSFISYGKIILSRSRIVTKSIFSLSDIEVELVILDKDIRMLKKLCTKKYVGGFREYEEYIVCENPKGDKVFLNFWTWNNKGIITYAN